MYDRDTDLPVWRLEHFPQYPGLVVRVQPPTLGAVIAADRALPILAAGRAKALDILLGPFADSLLSWTVTKSGRPVPPTRGGLLTLDPTFVLDILQTWVRIAKNPPTAQPQIDEPPAGEIDDEEAERLELQASIPMQPLPTEAGQANTKQVPEPELAAG